MSFPRPAAFCAALLAASVLAPAPAAAQAPADSSGAAAPPAVRLDVRRLALDSLSVRAERVEAHLRIDAAVADLLRIDAGLSVRVDSARVLVRGLDAEANLDVRLDVVARVLLEALGVVDRHPEAFGVAPDSAAADSAAPQRLPSRDRPGDG